MSLIPSSSPVTAHERWRAIIGAMLGLAVTALLGQGWAHWSQASPVGNLWASPSLDLTLGLVAPMGATTVILFALPSSPLAQPWAVLGGNALSALTGVAVASWVMEPLVMPGSPSDLSHVLTTGSIAGLAVAAAMVVMFAARCLHPPGGAVALLAVLNHSTQPLHALAPVLLNSAVLVAMAAIYNTRTGRPYPHRAGSTLRESPAHGPRFNAADLDAALARYNEIVDIDREDLEALLHEAEAQAWQRTLGQMRCQEIMSRQLVTVHQSDSLTLAWQRLHEHSIKALPVVDMSGHVVGIVTMADFVKRLAGINTAVPMAADSVPAGLAGSVEDVMTRRVRVATDTLRVIDLLPLFSEGGHHHLPVIDEQKVLVGMITQSDVVRALHRTMG